MTAAPVVARSSSSSVPSVPVAGRCRELPGIAEQPRDQGGVGTHGIRVLVDDRRREAPDDRGRAGVGRASTVRSRVRDADRPRRERTVGQAVEQVVALLVDRLRPGRERPPRATAPIAPSAARRRRRRGARPRPAGGPARRATAARDVERVGRPGLPRLGCVGGSPPVEDVAARDVAPARRALAVVHRRVPVARVHRGAARAVRALVDRAAVAVVLRRPDVPAGSEHSSRRVDEAIVALDGARRDPAVLELEPLHRAHAERRRSTRRSSRSCRSRLRLRPVLAAAQAERPGHRLARRSASSAGPAGSRSSGSRPARASSSGPRPSRSGPRPAPPPRLVERRAARACPASSSSTSSAPPSRIRRSAPNRSTRTRRTSTLGSSSIVSTVIRLRRPG